jgi:hypothetical protein
VGPACLKKREKGGHCGLAGLVCLGWFGPTHLASDPFFLLNSFLFNFLFSTKHFKQGRKLAKTKFNFFCKIQVNQNSTAGDIEQKN